MKVINILLVFLFLFITSCGGEKRDESREKITEKSDNGENGEKIKSVGTALLKDDGTIILVLGTGGATDQKASILVQYKPKDKEYQKIIEHVGGLKAGEAKNIPPWPEMELTGKSH